MKRITKTGLLFFFKQAKEICHINVEFTHSIWGAEIKMLERKATDGESPEIVVHPCLTKRGYAVRIILSDEHFFEVQND